MAIKKRRTNNSIRLIREIVLCVMALLAFTFALVFIFGYRALKVKNEEYLTELEDARARLAEYENTEDPYIKQSEAEANASKATENQLEEAKNSGREDLLAELKNQLANNNGILDNIRKFYPDDIVLYQDNQFIFSPVDQDIPKYSQDNSKYSVSDDGRISYNDSEVETRTGIDVSKFQEEINWSKVAADGIDFAIIRAGLRGYSKGDIFEDEYFEDNMEGAEKYGVDVGVYFFSQAISDEEAIEEAEYLLDLIEPYKITYPVVVDVEHTLSSDGRGNKLTAEERTQYTKTFCERIAKAGYTPMIYGNLRTFTFMLNTAELDDILIWIASYEDTPYYPYHYDMWQYTEKADVNGISEPVDMNISFYVPE